MRSCRRWPNPGSCQQLLRAKAPFVRHLSFHTSKGYRDPTITLGRTVTVPESSYAISTSSISQQNYNWLKPMLDENDHIQVINLVKPYYGYGPQETNNWLDRNARLIDRPRSRRTAGLLRHVGLCRLFFVQFSAPVSICKLASRCNPQTGFD